MFDHKFYHLEWQYSLLIKIVGSGARLPVFETQFSICRMGDIGHLSVPQFSQSKIGHNYSASIRIKIHLMQLKHLEHYQCVVSAQ